MLSTWRNEAKKRVHTTQHAAVLTMYRLACVITCVEIGQARGSYPNQTDVCVVRLHRVVLHSALRSCRVVRSDADKQAPLLEDGMNSGIGYCRHMIVSLDSDH